MLLELVLLIVQVVCNLLAQEVVVEGPVPPVAALNRNVTYTCRANGIVAWAINEKQVHFDEAYRTSLTNIGIYVPSEQELVTVARIDPAQVNGTYIQCQWLGRDIIEGILGRSPLINFTTYGIPSSPSDLVIQVDVAQGGYTLSWTPGFQFSTENVTFSITASTTIMSQVYNATDPSVFILTPASGTTCTQYNVTIVAENAVGASDTSLQITVPAPTAPKLLEADAVVTSVSLVNYMASFHITFKDPSPCSEFAVQHYSLMLFEVANSINGSLSSPIVSMPSFTISKDTGMMITISVNGSNGVLVNREYIVTLTATNNVSSSQLNLSVSTAGLQAAHILVNMSTLTVTCTFAEGSGALGCVALLSDDMLVRANVSDGNLVAMNTALWPSGAQVDNVVVVEVLQSGDISAIRTRPSIATIPTTPSSTFDVYNLTSTTNSGLEYSVLFVDNSDALGVFITLLHKNEELIDFTKSIYFVQGRKEAEIVNQLSGISSGTYQVLVYDLGENGEIFSSLAAYEDKVIIVNPQSGTFFRSSKDENINCTSSLSDFMEGVEVWCEYNTSIYNGFTAYIQNQRDPQLVSASSKISRSSVRVNGSQNGDHLVFVYPIWYPTVEVLARREPVLWRTYSLSGFMDVATTTPASDSATTMMVSLDNSVDGIIDSIAIVAGGVGGVIIVLILLAILSVVCVIVLTLKCGRKKNNSSKNLKSTGEANHEVPAMNTTFNMWYGLASTSETNANTTPGCGNFRTEGMEEYEDMQPLEASYETVNSIEESYTTMKPLDESYEVVQLPVGSSKKTCSTQSNKVPLAQPYEVPVITRPKNSSKVPLAQPYEVPVITRPKNSSKI